jgi:type IV pilus assembly protein PilC
MCFSARISTKALAGLCRRLSTVLEAGIDVRTAWSREADRARGPLHRRLLDISHAVDQGRSLGEAVADCGDFFPTLFGEMIKIAEETGHLDGVLAQMADHYDNQIKMRRIFMGAIAWPLFQLGAAILAIGFLIWITGWIRQSGGGPNVDILGFGLVGDQGLVIYITFLAIVGTLFLLVIRGINRGLIWTRPIQHLVLRIPVLGDALQTLALSRMAWSMEVTMNTGMDIRRALMLSLRSTQNARYIDQIPAIDASIMHGNSLIETFRLAGGYPVDFLDTLAVGEESGKVVESMGRLARQYQERARLALATLALVAGWAVWAIIAAIIIALIFRLFSFYIGAINNAASGRF